MTQRIRLKDIAQQLHVSTVTVSNALSGKKGVSEPLRAQIFAKAAEMGFDLSRYESTHEESVTVGVIVARDYIFEGASFYWEMYRQVTKAAAKQGCLIALEILQTYDENAAFPRILTRGNPDALIVIGRLPERYLQRILQGAGIPVVLMDYYRPQFHCDAVLSANYTGMYKATEYLIARGHTQIAFVGTGGTSNNVRERFYGFSRCMRDYGLSVRTDWLIEERDLETEEICLQLPQKLPTAFACSSDYAARFVYDQLEIRGLRVPEDVSLVGYDDSLFGHPLAQILTTCKVDLTAMAMEAVSILRRRMQGDLSEPWARYLDGSMVERGSVRTLRGGRDG